MTCIFVWLFRISTLAVLTMARGNTAPDSRILLKTCITVLIWRLFRSMPLLETTTTEATSARKLLTLTSRRDGNIPTGGTQRLSQSPTPMGPKLAKLSNSCCLTPLSVWAIMTTTRTSLISLLALPIHRPRKRNGNG